jgi:hypothetical protein
MLAVGQSPLRARESTFDATRARSIFGTFPLRPSASLPPAEICTRRVDLINDESGPFSLDVFDGRSVTACFFETLQTAPDPQLCEPMTMTAAQRETSSPPITRHSHPSRTPLTLAAKLLPANPGLAAIRTLSRLSVSLLPASGVLELGPSSRLTQFGL